MHIRRFETAGFALALLLSTSLASAISAQPGPGPHAGFGLERKLDQLNLPKDTRAAVQKVVEEAKPQAQKLGEEIRSAHQTLRGLLEKDPVDESAVMAQADAVGKLMTEERKLHLGTLIHVRALLTPEQRAELTKLMQERGPRGMHGGRGGQRGPGMEAPGPQGPGPQGPGGPQDPAPQDEQGY